MLQVLGEKSFEKFGKYFISMHFSDQQSGVQKKKLMFKFALPDLKNMADMTRLVALVPYYIDLVGRYKLSSQVRQVYSLLFLLNLNLSLIVINKDYFCDCRHDPKLMQPESRLPKRHTKNCRMPGKNRCREGKLRRRR